MFIDARTLDTNTIVQTDICIIGAGAAGISLALEFIDSRFDICILESGGLEYDDDTQALFDGKNTGFPYYDLEKLRLRYFGGTTNHWAGACRPLDVIDFEKRDWIPDSGWPITRAQLDPYYKKAHAVCELGPYNYDPAVWEGIENPRLPFKGDRIYTAMFQASPPTRFGAVYRDSLEAARNISTYLYANAVNMETSEQGDNIRSIGVTTLDKSVDFTVRATQVVLATGAIENARILLACNRQNPAGLGNRNDLVGRYFMEHLSLPGATYLPSSEDIPMGLYKKQVNNGTPAKGYLSISPNTQRADKLLNMRAFILETTEIDAMHASIDGLHALDDIREIMNNGSRDDDLAPHVSRAMTDFDDILVYSYRKLFRRPGRRTPYYLYYHVEQAPNPDSRVGLSDETDALGMPKVELSWKFTGLEKHTIDRATQIIAEELGYSGLGHVKKVVHDPDTGWPSSFRGLRGAWHQMGTTRMHDSPANGVVDADCRVHGINNLYIAGSSVFPTSGYTNPTLTIVALAIRLGDHLEWKLEKGIQ